MLVSVWANDQPASAGDQKTQVLRTTRERKSPGRVMMYVSVSSRTTRAVSAAETPFRKSADDCKSTPMVARPVSFHRRPVRTGSHTRLLARSNEFWEITWPELSQFVAKNAPRQTMKGTAY